MRKEYVDPSGNALRLCALWSPVGEARWNAARPLSEMQAAELGHAIAWGGKASEEENRVESKIQNRKVEKENTHMLKYALLTFTLIATIGQTAEKHINWEKGKVLSQDMNSRASGTYIAPLGNATVAVPIYRSWNNVTIETKDYVYQWTEAGNSRIILPVNAEIVFYRDGKWFIVLDRQKKKHKFGLMGMSSRTASSDPK